MLKHVIRRVHPNPPLETPPTRFSMHPMGHLSMPSLRWRGKTPTHHKSPLLGLKLSSKSFLDTSLEDDLSATTVYTINTAKASTSVLRYGNEDSPLEIATINWHGAVSTNDAREDDNPLLVKMKDCRWSEGPVFLRSGSNPNSSRKFTIPGYSHTMKWKRYGNSYWCTTSGIKGPIATLDLAHGQEPISLMVYETLRDKSDSKALLAFKGVSFLLLDYLIVTALLCVTDLSAWKEVGAMQDIAFWNSTNSGQEIDVVSRFSDCSSVQWSRELHRNTSETSLATTVSAFLQPPSKLFGSGMATQDKSRSMWYSDTPTIKDSLKALLHSATPNSSTEADVQHPDSSASHMPIKKPTHGLRNVPSLLSRPSTSTSTSSLFKPDPELSRSLDQPTTTSIHSPQQPPLGLDNKESLPSEQLPNVSESESTNYTHNGSESYRRPLPKPPRELALRRTQSSAPTIATRTRTFRTLPPTPLHELPESNESRPSVSGNSRIHLQSPSMKKLPPELTGWVLSSTPSPATVAFDLPPSYSSIYSVQGDKPNSISTSTTSAPST